MRGAQAGAINLLLGGDAAERDRVRPRLEPWTSGVRHLGPLGAGQVGKTANDLVRWALANTADLARRVGMDIPVAETGRRVMAQTTVDDVARLLADGSLRTGESA